MTADEARHLVIEGIGYAAYKETASALYDSDKNNLFEAEHYSSGCLAERTSPWEKRDFEEKMATLLNWANELNRSVAAFGEAQAILAGEDSTLGRVIRAARRLGKG